MCVYSAVADQFLTPWKYPNVGGDTTIVMPSPITRAEFDALKAEVEKLRELLEAAKAVDEFLGEPDCENDEKVELLRKIAELVGVDLEDVLNG